MRRYEFGVLLIFAKNAELKVAIPTMPGGIRTSIREFSTSNELVILGTLGAEGWFIVHADINKTSEIWLQREIEQTEYNLVIVEDKPDV